MLKFIGFHLWLKSMGKHVGKDMKNYFLQVYSKASCSTIPTDA